MENRFLDPDVKVNGKAARETLLKDGDRILVDKLEMVYRFGDDDS